MAALDQPQNLQASCFLPTHDKHAKPPHEWTLMGEGDGDDDTYNTSSLDNSTSTTSSGSISSFDMADDASSSSSSSLSSISNGPLYELSQLMAHLPIKRGLSKHYQGKSQSFASLSRVTSIEDLAKKENPYKKKIKASKSCGNGLDAHKSYTLPKPTICKKVPRTTPISSLSFPSKRGSFLNASRPPLVPLQKKF